MGSGKSFIALILEVREQLCKLLGTVWNRGRRREMGVERVKSPGGAAQCQMVRPLSRQDTALGRAGLQVDGRCGAGEVRKFMASGLRVLCEV